MPGADLTKWSDVVGLPTEDQCSDERGKDEEKGNMLWLCEVTAAHRVQ
jgi:hypothetical protein